MADAAALTSDNSPPRVLAWPMEAVLATVVVAAPWMYGAVHPGFEFVLDGGVALLLVLWAVRMLWERQLTIARCPVTVLLALLVLLGLFQITPLSPSILRTVSPTTALLYERLLPSSPETLPAAAPSKAEGLTISLAPDATRNRCFRLLAVLLVFAMVRNNLGNISALTRLAFVLVINGFALCLFGVIQHLTSPPDTLYWTYPSLGQVFGPFVSRNMFPYYVNMCIGLGIGLILGRLARQSREPIGGVQSSTRYQAKAPLTPLATKRIGGAQPGTQYQAKVPLTQLTAKQQQALQSLAGIWDQAKAALTRAVSFWLHDAPSLWLLAAVAFMGSAVAFSLSRGGFAALVGALLFVAVVSRGIAGRGILLAGAAVVAGLALFFLAWSGMSVVEKRLNTLWEPEKADQARVPMWLRVLPAVPEFPFWGTGFGTFQYVEVWKRGEQPIVPSENPTDLQPLEPLLFEHAHNDYVETVVEAGLPGLALVLAILVLVFRYGFQAIARFSGGRRAAMATGALCGLTAVAIHSAVDFGMQAPAIALLATVLCAMVCSVGSQQPRSPGVPVWQLRLGGVAPAVGAATLVLLGLMLCAHTWRLHLVERLQAAAAQVTGTERRRLQLPYLEAAVRLAPQNAGLRLELAQAQLDLLQIDVALAERLNTAGVVADSCLVVPALIPSLGPSFAYFRWIARAELFEQERDKVVRKHLYVALAECVAARNANPLMIEPHLTLGIYANALARHDPQQNYFERVKLVAPRLPDVWFYSGLAELAEAEKLPDLEQANNVAANAWQDWRRCLTLSDRFLDTILVQTRNYLKKQSRSEEAMIDQLIGKVLPERPELMVKAGERLFPDQKQKQSLFRRKALQVLERMPEPLSTYQRDLKFKLRGELEAENKTGKPP